MAEVQTPAVSSSKDNALLVFSIVAILGGIAAFYWYTEPALPLRIGMVVLGLAAGAGLFWRRSSRPGVGAFGPAARVRVRQAGGASRPAARASTQGEDGFGTSVGLCCSR